MFRLKRGEARRLWLSAQPGSAAVLSIVGTVTTGGPTGTSRCIRREGAPPAGTSSNLNLRASSPAPTL